jgi:hypothetical protein
MIKAASCTVMHSSETHCTDFTPARALLRQRLGYRQPFTANGPVPVNYRDRGVETARITYKRAYILQVFLRVRYFGGATGILDQLGAATTVRLRQQRYPATAGPRQ